MSKLFNMIYDEDAMPVKRNGAIAGSVFAFVIVFGAIFGIANGIWPTADDAAECVTYRPPSWVYMMMWILIGFCLSISWTLVFVRGRKKDGNPRYGKIGVGVTTAFMLVILSLCVLWSALYNMKDNTVSHMTKIKNGQAMFLLLVPFSLIALLYLCFRVNIYSGVLLSPLLIWAVFNLFVISSELGCTPIDGPHTADKTHA